MKFKEIPDVDGAGCLKCEALLKLEHTTKCLKKNPECQTKNIIYVKDNKAKSK